MRARRERVILLDMLPIIVMGVALIAGVMMMVTV